MSPCTVGLELPTGTCARRRPSWLALVRFALPLLAAVGLCTALRDGDRGRALGLLAGHLPWLPLVLLPFVAGMACDACSMWLMLGSLGWRLPYRQVLRLRMAAEGALFTLPAGSIAAEALKPVLLRRRHGVPLSVGAATVLVNKAFIVLTNALYLVLGLVCGGALLRAALPGRWAGLLPAVTAGGAIGCLVLGGALMVAVRRSDLLDRLVARLPARWRPARRGPALADTAPFFADWRRAAGCCSLAMLHWLLEAFETWAAARLIGLPLSPSGALAFESLLALMRSLAFFLPGGIGLQDGGHMLLAHLAGSSATVAGGMLVIVKRGKELLWTLVAAFLMPAGDAAAEEVTPLRPRPVTVEAERFSEVVAGEVTAASYDSAYDIVREREDGLPAAAAAARARLG